MLRFPSEITGWLTEAEGAELYRLAQGKKVLEVGSYCGRSTVCLAQSAESVVSVDPHDGRDTPNECNTLGAFRDNITRYGLASKVTAHVGTFADCKADIVPPFDLVFIDGAHDATSVRHDLQLACRAVAKGGLIVCHDYENTDPGVTMAVDEMVSAGAFIVSRVGSLIAMTPVQNYVAAVNRKKVFLASPCRPGGVIHRGAARSIYAGGCHTPGVTVLCGEAETSVLPWTFDQLWCMGINHYEKGEATHFAMHHDDIGAQPNWLGVMLEELELLDADILSAVVPLKDNRGVTSTAEDTTGDKWNPKRYTLKEVYDRPESFTHPDILLNSGLWVCDLSKPWVHKEHDGILACSFHQRNRIRRGPDGWMPVMRSEDWEFSRDVRKAGGHKQYATRKVKLWHGEPCFTNTEVWGTCSSDPVHELVAV